MARRARRPEPDAVLTQRMADNFPAVAHDLLNPLLELLCVARATCAGDTDKFLVLLVVAVRTVQHPRFKDYENRQLLDGDPAVFPTLGTNVRSIAASLGMPKETVRRKVSDLVADGWLVRRGHSLYFTAVAAREMAGVSQGVQRLALRYHDVVAALSGK